MTQAPDVTKAFATLLSAIFTPALQAALVPPAPAPVPATVPVPAMEVTHESPETFERRDQWRHLQPYHGASDKLSRYNPEHRFRIEIDPERSIEDQQLEEGSGIMLVKTEEVWATDRETGELSVKLVSNTYMKRLEPEDASLLTAKLYSEGVLHEAMKDYFR